MPTRAGGPSSHAGLAAVLTGTIPRLALVIVLFIVTWNYVVYGGSDPYKCAALGQEGHWPPVAPDVHKWQRWEPSGCRMHTYTREDFHDCLRYRRMVFIGDSTTRQLYWAAARRLDHQAAEVALLKEYISTESKQKDITLTLMDVKLEFIWDPWLNSSGLHEQLSRFREWPTFSDVDSTQGAGESASMVVLGAPGLYAARHGGSTYLDIFKSAIDTTKPHLKVKVTIPHVGSNGVGYKELPNQVVLTPVQVPWYDQLTPGRLETITPDKVNNMNGYLRHLTSAEQTHILWSFERMSDNIWEAYEETGLHVVDSIADRRLDILLNTRCNAALSVKGRQYTYTCCMAYPSLSRGQWFLILANIGLLASICSMNRQSASARNTVDSPCRNLTVLALAVFYCYMADRTHAFPKTTAIYEVSPVWIKTGVLAVVFILSFRKQRPLPNAKGQPVGEREFMPREISDEAKGIIQAFLLIAHFHGVFHETWGYKLMRFMIAAYIYLSAYGHSTYFLTTDDFSFQRVAKVLIKINLLPVLASFALNTDWTFYGFIPGINFWFMVVYLTHVIIPKWNADPLRLLLKVVISALVFTIIIQVPFFLDTLSWLCSVTLRVSWSANTFRTTLSLDRYITYFGILSAIIAQRISMTQTKMIFSSAEKIPVVGPRVGRISKGVDGILSKVARPDVVVPLKPLAALISAIALITWFICTQKLAALGDAEKYDSYHPYISIIPILSYAILRNAFASLRRVHLELPRLLGRISLATYVLHHHVWLAGNASTILGVGLVDLAGEGFFSKFGGAIENALLTILLLWVSGWATEAVAKTSAWVIGEAEQTEAPSASSGGLLEQPAQTRLVQVVDDKGVKLRVGMLCLGLWLGNLIG